MTEHDLYEGELDVPYAASYASGTTTADAADLSHAISYEIATSEYIDTLQQRIALCEERIYVLEQQCSAADANRAEEWCKMLHQLEEWFHIDVSDLL